MEEVCQPVSVTQCFNCQSFGHSPKNCRSKPKCLVCGLRVTHTKDARIRKLGNLSVLIVRCHMLRLIKGVLYNAKSRQHVVNNQKSYAAAVGQKTLTQPITPQTFLFTAEQLTKFVANVVIQIAQPQICYPNPKHDMLDLKSSMCRKISNAAISILSVDITGKDLF